VDAKVLIDQRGSSVWRVALSAEHDLATAPELDAALTDVAQHGTDMIVDMSEATFADSTTLQTILRHAVELPASLVIVAVPGTEPRRMLDLAGAA
jgi:anti-anti-sigma regulatory factor